MLKINLLRKLKVIITDDIEKLDLLICFMLLKEAYNVDFEVINIGDKNGDDIIEYVEKNKIENYVGFTNFKNKVVGNIMTLDSTLKDKNIFSINKYTNELSGESKEFSVSFTLFKNLLRYNLFNEALPGKLMVINSAIMTLSGLQRNEITIDEQNYEDEVNILFFTKMLFEKYKIDNSVVDEKWVEDNLEVFTKSLNLIGKIDEDFNKGRCNENG